MIKYVAVEKMTGGWEIVHEYITTKLNDKFVLPRVLKMWLHKADRIYRVYPDNSCEILKGRW